MSRNSVRDLLWANQPRRIGVVLKFQGRRMINNRPVVYIASPYSNGDPAINTHFQCRIFDQLFSDGLVLPVAPLWSHFQHMMFPRPYEDWIEYDQAILLRFDACLRLDADLPSIGYKETRSSGADSEAETFRRIGKPVFYDIESLYDWVKQRSKNQ